MGYILNGLLRAIEDIVSKYFFIVFQSAWRTIAGGSWHCTGGSDQNRPQEKEMQKSKMIVWAGLKNSYGKKRSERQRRKGKIYRSESWVPKNSKERWESSLMINAKK